MGKSVNIVNKIFFFSFLIFGFIFLLLNKELNIIFFSFGSALAFMIISYIFERKSINKKFIIFANIALWLNILGELIFYYNPPIPYYDKLLHFFITIFITAVIYDYYSKKLVIRKDMIFLSVLGLLCLWEIFEYFIFTVLNYPLVGVTINGQVVQSPYDDTMFDLIFGALGSLVYLLIKRK